LLGGQKAFANFVAERHDLGAVVDHLHVISLISPVRGVLTMVLRVIPAPHGKATADVNAEIKRIVGIINSSGLSVEVVCIHDGSTYVSRLAGPFARVGVPESCDLRLPVHRQTQLRARIGMPGTFACFCTDADYQGKGRRFLRGEG
jgi:hypothetical protein